MIAHSYSYRADNAHANEPSRIVVMPSSEKYVEGMQKLQVMAYNPAPDEMDTILVAEKFRNHLRMFPEGQFVAVDTATDEVVGLTASMRLQFNPAEALLASWNATTGDG